MKQYKLLQEFYYRPKIILKMDSNLGCIFSPIFGHFGSFCGPKSGSKMDPKPIQNRTKDGVNLILSRVGDRPTATILRAQFHFFDFCLVF